MRKVAEADQQIMVSVRVPANLAIAARIEASKQNLSRSELIRRLLVERLNELKEGAIYAA